MQNIRYRIATVQDEEKIISMARAFHIEDGHPLAASSEDAIRSALRGNELGKIYLVQNESEVCGYFVLCNTLSIEFGGLVIILDDFYIIPKMRQMGLGGFLLGEIKKIAENSNAVQVFLEVENKNARAKKFYIRNGFKVRDRGMMEFIF